MSRGETMNYAPGGRALLRPEEILRLGEEYMVAFVRGMPSPILARRVEWYADRSFNPAAKKQPRRRSVSASWIVWWVLVYVLFILVMRAMVNGYGYWSPDFQNWEPEIQNWQPEIQRRK